MTPQTLSVHDIPAGPRTQTHHVAGWLKAGMLDWDGHLTTTIFISGCNLSCPYCHNPELTKPAEGVDLKGLFEHLDAKRDWIDGVVVTGGEPTTDPALFELLDEFASRCLPVKLDTNGTRPDVLSQIIESRLVSYVALDIKTTPSNYSDLTGSPTAWTEVEKSIHTLLGSGMPHEFRTTLYPDAVALEELPTLARTLAGGDLYALQQFRPQKTLDASASEHKPYAADDVREAVKVCRTFLPTIARGV